MYTTNESMGVVSGAVTTTGMTTTTFVTGISVVMNKSILNANFTEDNQNVACNDWLDVQHAVFQLANLCVLISFLTPSSFKHHCFFLRVMLNFGYLLIVIWAALFVCMPDIVAWNSAFFVFNSLHMLYLGYKIVPDRFSKTLDDVYLHTFKPLRVSRKQFKELVEFGSMMLLAKGAIYAHQGQHPTGHRLSLLIKGRLKASYDEIYLHSIDANQFVDSPEFDHAYSTDSENVFQVTVSAIDDSLIFTWPYKRLVEHLSTNQQLSHVFRQIIGKDISQKLYEIQERLMANPNYNMDRRSSMVNVRHSIVSGSTTNLTKLNCLQGCIPHTENHGHPSSNGSYETSV